MNEKELEECYNKCIEYSNKIKNPILRECCQKIYSDYKEKLINKPATPGRHHYFRGGLLDHIYSVTRNSYNIVQMYPNLHVDEDLVLFGALLHDLGKVEQYYDFSENEDYIARKGNTSELLGHTYEGTHIVDNYLSKYEIDEVFKNQVLHMIGSHMRIFMNEGVLVKIKMLEARIISFGDYIDGFLDQAVKPINEAKPGGEYEFPLSENPYYKSLNPYYKG